MQQEGKVTEYIKGTLKRTNDLLCITVMHSDNSNAIRDNLKHINWMGEQQKGNESARFISCTRAVSRRRNYLGTNFQLQSKPPLRITIAQIRNGCCSLFKGYRTQSSPPRLSALLKELRPKLVKPMKCFSNSQFHVYNFVSALICASETKISLKLQYYILAEQHECAQALSP